MYYSVFQADHVAVHHGFRDFSLTVSLHCSSPTGYIIAFLVDFFPSEHQLCVTIVPDNT